MAVPPVTPPVAPKDYSKNIKGFTKDLEALVSVVGDTFSGLSEAEQFEILLTYLVTNRTLTSTDTLVTALEKSKVIYDNFAAQPISRLKSMTLPI